MTPKHRATRALGHLPEIDPALSVLSLWCTHKDDSGETRSRENSIFYGPNFEQLNLAEQVGIVAHHVLHAALQHSQRQIDFADRLGEAFAPDLFALACDAIINETLLVAEHALPRPTLRLTELLRDLGEESMSPITALQEWDAERLALFLHSDAARSQSARKHGARRGFRIDLEPGNRGAGTEENASRTWRNQLIQALEAGRKAGSGIGKLGAIWADMAPAGVPWEVELRGLLARALAPEPILSYRRPASRWVASAAQASLSGTLVPVFQPARNRDALRPRIAVAIDTSSSINGLTLSLFWNETEGVSRRMGAETHLIAFDDDIHLQREVGPFDWPVLRDEPLRTGGGTNYAPVFAACDRLQPSVLVMLTDLEASVPVKPEFPVVWAVPGATDATVAPFGRILSLDTVV